MTRKIVWKFNVPVEEHFTLEMPLGSEILHFGIQYGTTRLWVLVDPSKEYVKRRFLSVGTGHDIVEGGLKYIGTVKMIDEHSKEDELVVQIIGLQGKIERIEKEKKKLIEESIKDLHYVWNHPKDFNGYMELKKKWEEKN